MCMGYFTLDWNLSRSAQILGRLNLQIKTKLQNKTKTKPRKIFDSLCRHFSLAKFCQERYIIKKQNRGENVLLLNKNLNKVTIRGEYTVIIPLENTKHFV